MTSHKSEDYKITAVKHYLKSNKTQDEICKIFDCSARSLIRWVKRYNKENSIKRHSKKSISYKITNEHVKFLLDEVKKNKTITMEDLTIKLNDKFKNLDISRRHIANVIKNNNISLKLTHVQHIPIKRFGKHININYNLTDFYKEIKKYNLNDIICIDETSINALQIRNHCYNEVGKRCTIKTQSQDVFKKYTAIFAISTTGVICWEMYEKGGIDSDRLYKFIETNITNKYKNKLIILDNASSHRNEIIKTLVNKDNKILYSVPYQHYTNAIENYFSVLKSKLRKIEGIKYDELKENIKNVLKIIPKETYMNIFKGTYERQIEYKKKFKSKKTSKNYKN